MEKHLQYVAMGAKPDPHKFDVVETRVVNGNTIVLARYHGCLTFGGLKLILLKGRPEITDTLDPHFLDGDHAVMARFTPNEIGWSMAAKCAEII